MTHPEAGSDARFFFAMNPTLLLFDIDGTLLDTAGAGAGALLDAAEAVLEVSRDELPPLDLAGATDKSVVRKLFEDANQDPDASRVEAFHSIYLERLRERMNDDSFRGALLPGVEALLDRLRCEQHFILGLLTGNMRAGAQIKLERFGIHEHFLDGGFGDDAELRHEIGAIAVQRLASATGLAYAPQQVVVIGDTPKDIACAEAIGARCVAVATGRFSVEELLPFGSAMVLSDLTDTSRMLSLLAA